jgi:hypothetical protein
MSCPAESVTACQVLVLNFNPIIDSNVKCDSHHQISFSIGRGYMLDFVGQECMTPSETSSVHTLKYFLFRDLHMGGAGDAV